MSSPTFDAISEKIDTLWDKIESTKARIERLKECKPTERRLRRIQRLEDAISRRENTIVELNEQRQRFTDEVSDGPSDSLKVDFWQDPVTGNKYGLSLAITDTGYDDTYIGGTDLTVQVEGSGYHNGRGFKSFRKTYTGLVSEEFAPVDDTATVGFSLSETRVDGSYPDLSVTLFDANNNIVFSQLVYQDGQSVI